MFMDLGSNNMKTTFHKEYDGENICDVARDIMESFDDRFNPEVKDIPVDENFIQEGRFIVTVQWTPYEDE